MISCFSALPSSIASTFSSLARISAFLASSCCRMYRPSSPFSRSTNVLITHTVAGRAAFFAATVAVDRITDTTIFRIIISCSKPDKQRLLYNVVPINRKP